MAYAIETPACNVVPRPILRYTLSGNIHIIQRIAYSSMITRDLSVAWRKIPAVLFRHISNKLQRQSSNLNKHLLNHFKHKSAPIPPKIISSSHSAEDSIHDSHLHIFSRNKASALGKYCYDRSLSEKSRFSSLIWAGDDMQMGIRSHMSTVWGEIARSRQQRRFNRRMSAINDL